MPYREDANYQTAVKYGKDRQRSMLYFALILGLVIVSLTVFTTVRATHNVAVTELQVRAVRAQNDATYCILLLVPADRTQAKLNDCFRMAATAYDLQPSDLTHGKLP